jgi:hypothetical protein
LLVAVAAYDRRGLLTSAEIRLDTGDLRYRYLGLPLVYERMPEPQRSQLLALAAGPEVLCPAWHACATFPLPSSNNTHLMCRGWYAKACVWAKQDPRLARLMLEDVANYIATKNAAHGLPECSMMLSALFIEPDAGGRLVLKQGWRQCGDVAAYATERGYNLPTTEPGE